MRNDRRIKTAFFFALFCTLVMLFEDIGEAMGIEWVETWDDMHIWEFFILGPLLIATIILGIEFKSMQRTRDSLEEGLKVASGSFNRLLEAHYDAWGLTPSEREVTKLILKGCSNHEIAEIRNAATGTIKAQTHSIYTKSGLAGKNQLLGFLLEELTDGGSIAA